MKQLILYMSMAFLGLCMACNRPQQGSPPANRDSIGDPIDPQDTTVDRLDPDSAVTNEPRMQF